MKQWTERDYLGRRAREEASPLVLHDLRDSSVMISRVDFGNNHGIFYDYVTSTFGSSYIILNYKRIFECSGIFLLSRQSNDYNKQF